MIKPSAGGTAVPAISRRRAPTRRMLAASFLVAGVLGTSASAAVSAVTSSTWAQVPTPNAGGSSNDDFLRSVAVTSTSNAWVVGDYDDGTAARTLILHWNGSRWTEVASPNPGTGSNYDELWSTAATSASNAWAVGDYWNGTAKRTLILHWNGTRWTKVASPNAGGAASANFLDGVVATSASNVWAIGGYDNGTATQTLILHWNGTRWTKVASPNPGGSSNDNRVNGVVATSATNAWAVGYYYDGTTYQTLVLHWDGTSWTKVSSPNPSGSSNFNELLGVAATSASNAWAVGEYLDGTILRTLILHWNGTSWTKLPSPNPGGSSYSDLLHGVAATSTSNAWAVGDYDNGTASRTLVAHCC